ncbi:MAG: PQQ-binding-like beta-propeller repeat protein [Anaerolineae bacterium]|nr:MAG: PQQ-binding-like beta-propeller repeat protein [Anaerolineae bacterium]
MKRITRALSDITTETAQLGQLEPGVTLQERYLVLALHGAGGMSSVYRARDLHFPNVTKTVAVKEMINMATDPAMHEMIVRNFEREADLLATLSHPAIPRIFDYFTHESSSYLVMEFIDGKDLEALLRETDDFLPENQVVKWAIELCDVLNYLHLHKPQPVIFRDVKPSNIMIDGHSSIRLIDFGIARIFQPGQKGTMIGTDGYAPPEQYRGEASPPGDMYALGATLHHLLTRRDPRAEPPFSFSERPIRSINEKVSPELEATINAALSYDPADRFPTAEAMRSSLISVAKETGILVSPRTAASAGQPSNEVQEIWSFECEDEVRGSPLVMDGVVYIGCYDNNLYALDAKTGEFIWKFATEGGIASRPASDGELVYVSSEDTRMYALSAQRGTLAWTYYTGGPIRSSPVVFEGHIFIGADDARLHVVNMFNGSAAWKQEVAGPIRSTPTIIDERVYFGCESSDFYCYDFRGELKWRFGKARRGITSSPIMVEGMLFFGSMDWSLYALEAEAGWQIWKFRMGRPTISSPVFAEGRIYTGCADGRIYAIDSRGGREIWHFQTEHQVTGSPTIFEDSIFCGSVDGSMYCLDMRSGRKRWQFQTGGPITGTPTVSDNRIYFGSNDHRVYALLT